MAANLIYVVYCSRTDTGGELQLPPPEIIYGGPQTIPVSATDIVYVCCL